MKKLTQNGLETAGGLFERTLWQAGFTRVRGLCVRFDRVFDHGCWKGEGGPSGCVSCEDVVARNARRALRAGEMEDLRLHGLAEVGCARRDAWQRWCSMYHMELRLRSVHALHECECSLDFSVIF